VEALLSEKNADAQAAFYHQKWNTWRWRLLFKVFFSRWVMGRLGRDPEFLRQVEVEVGDFIFQRAEQQLSQPSASRNHILRYNLTGGFGSILPDYLSSETNFLTIRNCLDRVVLFKGFAQEAGLQYGPFDAMNLSNIFEYMDKKTFAETGHQLRDIARSGCRLGYWNLMVPRRLSQHLPADFRYEDALSAALTTEDRGFFYQQFVVDTCPFILNR
jgi:S-adenosylmethionine-diacylglycerol 3-amino-3-carboxypropyl transferase